MILIGAGSHSKQIYDILILKKIKIIGIYDDIYDINNEKYFYDYKIKGKIYEIKDKSIPLFCGIGDNNKRKEIFEKYVDYNWVNIIHPQSHISSTSKLGKGNYIGYNCYIGPDTILGNGNIINEQSSVLHDTILKDFNHVSIKASVGAKNIIGNNNFLGMHSLSIPNIIIGNENIIGANTTIIKNVESNKKLVGSPGRYI